MRKTKISPNPSFPKRGNTPNFPPLEKGDAGGFEGGFQVKFQVKRQRLSAHHIIHHSRGFTLFEIILTILILAIAIVPMMNAFAPALLSTGQGEEQVVLTGQARRTMNRLLDLDFRSLDTNRGNPANLVALFGSQAEVDKESFVYLGVNYAPPVVAICATSCAPNASCVRVLDCVTDDSDETRRGPLELTLTLKHVTLQTLKANR